MHINYVAFDGGLPVPASKGDKVKGQRSVITVELYLVDPF